MYLICLKATGALHSVSLYHLVMNCLSMHVSVCVDVYACNVHISLFMNKVFACGCLSMHVFACECVCVCVFVCVDVYACNEYSNLNICMNEVFACVCM